MEWWSRLFERRVEKFLLQQIAEEKQSHLNQISQLHSDYREQIKSLRERYSDEVQYLRERVKSVEDDLERTRLLLHPALNAISSRREIAAAEEQQENREPETIHVPPFVRMANDLREQDRQAREKQKQDFEARKLAELKAKESPQPAAKE